VVSVDAMSLVRVGESLERQARTGHLDPAHPARGAVDYLGLLGAFLIVIRTDTPFVHEMEEISLGVSAPRLLIE
jgi:hypothetical protein